MIILGLDPGTAITGYGIIKKEGGSLLCIDFGCITTPKGLEAATRLQDLHKELLNLVKKHKPDYAAVEQLFFAKNTRTALSVSHARGVALQAFASFGIPISEFTPLQVKQAVTSYGRAEKSQVQKMVKLLLNLEEIPKPDDAADALAVAICCANTNKYLNA